ncbi:hypothetical protein IMZ11_02515 [Microtetraspora sp. AC03309]|uniref:hypothetical protein n=1 Tax=Microtetraspora sp. AC03309 TaxID=2779376 RepID=UPI001E3F8270|nr:hypothetical protein [Microtetraspora sp. AC03309]MCC5574512.1 hypothetical protein [Microtetraspora sp. AC03309]
MKLRTIGWGIWNGSIVAGVVAGEVSLVAQVVHGEYPPASAGGVVSTIGLILMLPLFGLLVLSATYGQVLVEREQAANRARLREALSVTNGFEGGALSAWDVPGGTWEERSPEQAEVRAARLRLMAHVHRSYAAHLDLVAAAVGAGSAVNALVQAMADGDAADIAAHPDLAYLDLQVRGFYDDMPDTGRKG